MSKAPIAWREMRKLVIEIAGHATNILTSPQRVPKPVRDEAAAALVKAQEILRRSDGG